MKYVIFVLSLLVLCLWGTALAVAESEVDCSSSCPEGQVLVNYVDGNASTCVCTPTVESDAGSQKEAKAKTQSKAGEG